MCSRVKGTKRGGYGGRDAMKKLGEWESRILNSKEQPETLEMGKTVGVKWGGSSPVFSALGAVGNPLLLIFSLTFSASRFRLLLRGGTAKFPYRERSPPHTYFRKFKTNDY